MSGDPPGVLGGAVPRIEPLGDSALLVTLGDVIDLELNRQAQGLAAAVERLRRSGADRRFGRPVPAYASVLVPFDPLALDADEARAIVAGLFDGPQPPGTDEPGEVIEIPVRYGGDDGPDLAAIAAAHELTPADVVRLHSEADYRVYFLGFAPGFAYLGPLPAAIVTPRLATPRERVPAGSVAIADAQTGVYPFALPGGWRIIGRTDTPMWDLRRDRPSFLQPGARVRFRAIG